MTVISRQHSSMLNFDWLKQYAHAIDPKCSHHQTIKTSSESLGKVCRVRRALVLPLRYREQEAVEAVNAR